MKVSVRLPRAKPSDQGLGDELSLRCGTRHVLDKAPNVGGKLWLALTREYVPYCAPAAFDLPSRMNNCGLTLLWSQFALQ
jgi:hypothetical protein